ncbi:hypothetical protein [Brevifollis gellanilyticus]|uniref:SGNH hydrolase-type esterase domain-containing protein n=1 Tax=Brevifollis gellanilyticus TaxID=748831 RepID=A0A512M4B9_9BACT|nr:hypothetical protein [Brevifollis gellanilyticus]GEP41590.1 hypothetical protein BGE01nite_08810 [Brevifollis gellanilyticus]
MKLPPLLLLALTLASPICLLSQSADAPIDFDKARQLFEKRQGGGTLSEEETAYVRKAMATRESEGKGGQQPGEAIDWPRAQDLIRREQGGEKLSPEDQKYLDRAKEMRRRAGGGGGSPGGGGRGGQANQRKAPESMTPLTDMTAEARYEGEDGGLYGKGSNEPPAELQKSAEAALAQIQPLNAEGKPAADGKVVFVSISMSNATQEFSVFKRIADGDPRKSGKLTIVDCAQGGQTMAAWAPPDGRPWPEAMRRLETSGVTPQQVQVAWVKLANAGPSGAKTDHLKILEADTIKVLHNLRDRFPNLRIAYLGSRIYGGYATTGLNPEPYAYEGAFAVRHLIQQQISGDEALATAKSPLLLWGPYLWSEGEKGRKTDDLKYVKDDFGGDGTHPSDPGRQKVAKQLLEFFATSPLSKSWFAEK